MLQSDFVIELGIVIAMEEVVLQHTFSSNMMSAAVSFEQGI